MTNIRPQGDKILIKVLDREPVLPSGLILPDSVQKKPCTGKVIAKGPGKLNSKGIRIPCEAEIGDTIIYLKLAGAKAKGYDDDLLFLNQDDVLAIIKQGDDNGKDKNTENSGS